MNSHYEVTSKVPSSMLHDASPRFIMLLHTSPYAPVGLMPPTARLYQALVLLPSPLFPRLFSPRIDPDLPSPAAVFTLSPAPAPQFAHTFVVPLSPSPFIPQTCCTHLDPSFQVISIPSHPSWLLPSIRSEASSRATTCSQSKAFL